MTAVRHQPDDLSNLVLLNRADARVLSPEQERELLVELDECRKLLLTEYAQRRNIQGSAAIEELDIQDVVREMSAERGPGASLADRYTECRTRLAMANLRLVAHIARRYRGRGISTSDLLQEGFCGLLTSIDRYDIANTTRLASYAVWWIRQALQRAVAAGAYPVRLNPRHLQKLAASGINAVEGDRKPASPLSKVAETTLRQIHSATRPAVSLNATLGDSSGLSLLDSLSYPPDEEAEDLDADQEVDSLIQHLKPREQTVLRLRYGLDGGESQSLSQVSQVLDVSKERVRQIQNAALTKLRNLAAKDQMPCGAAQ